MLERQEDGRKMIEQWGWWEDGGGNEEQQNL